MTTLQEQPSMTAEQAFERLQKWYQEKAQLRTLKFHEHQERVAIATFYFPSPKEGTNRFDLTGGYDLKLMHGYDYKIERGEFDAVKPADIKKNKLPWDDLIDWEPKLNIKAFRALSTEQQKFVMSFVTIKPSSPQLEIVPQADREGQQVHKAVAEAAKAFVEGVVPAPLADAASTAPAGRVALKATACQPGQYLKEKKNWWCLDAGGETWTLVEDATLAAQLDVEHAQLKGGAAPVAPKKRAGRKAKE